MYKHLLIIIAGLITIAFESCDFEDKYVCPCEGKYGSDEVIDSLARRYDLNKYDFYFAQKYKDYLAPKHPNCDTITLRITSRITSNTIPFSVVS